MKTNEMLMIGGAAVAAYLLLNKSGGITAPTGINTGTGTSSILNPGGTTAIAGKVPVQQVLPGIVSTATVPTPPTNFDQTYFLTYVYPIAIASNPNLTNPNYQLSPTELNQYAANYLTIRQGVATWTSNGGNLNLNLQSHWRQYGVAQKLIFIPFLPTNTTPYVPPVSTSTTSGSGSSFGSILGDIGKGVALVSALAGVSDDVTPLELQVIATGAVIAKDLIPMYYAGSGGGAFFVEDNLNSFLTQYLP